MKPKADSLREGWPGRRVFGGDGVDTVQTQVRLSQGRLGRPWAVQGQEMHVDMWNPCMILAVTFSITCPSELVCERN